MISVMPVRMIYNILSNPSVYFKNNLKSIIFDISLINQLKKTCIHLKFPITEINDIANNQYNCHNSDTRIMHPASIRMVVFTIRLNSLS